MQWATAVGLEKIYRDQRIEKKRNQSQRPLQSPIEWWVEWAN